ncbi:DNA-damage-inducible SOS response protein [Erwinia tracheiphila PSU-1]|nr:DNA-damage-inducible SOS response protein [Erwinia tracheiphila PSU-1]
MRNGMLISVCSYGLTLFTVPILDNHGLWLEVTVFLIMRGVTLGAIW